MYFQNNSGKTWWKDWCRIYIRINIILIFFNNFFNFIVYGSDFYFTIPFQLVKRHSLSSLENKSININIYIIK